jgi:two-component system response regulator FixJ
MALNKLAPPAQSHPTGVQSVAERTVFVVDDDEAVLNSLQFALEIEGFKVRLFRNEGEILKQTEFPKSGCLVLDFNLPEMDGLQVLTVLRKRGVSLPAILITSHKSERISQRAAVAGVLTLEKPLLGNGLVEAIRGAIGPA